MKKLLALLLCIALTMSAVSFAMADAASNAEAATKAASMSYDELLEAAKGEGQVFSVGMPDEWANWKDLWAYIRELGIKTSDTDMSSAEELARFALEGKGDGDIGDIGISMASEAIKQDLVLPFKPSTWDSIPDYAKEENGLWVEAYTCTTAFITDLNNVKTAPTTWKEMLDGDYQVWIGDVEKAAQAYVGVLACAYSLGGDETNLEPALEFFGELAKQGRLITSNPYVENLEKGEIGVAVVWDFNALGYRETIAKNANDPKLMDRFAITIPSDGAASSGYCSVINKYANNPYAAMLVREIILSDAGQNFLALGHAKPIRTDVEFTDEAKAAILDNSLYSNVYQVKDWNAFNETVAALPDLWAENVAIYMN